MWCARADPRCLSAHTAHLLNPPTPDAIDADTGLKDAMGVSKDANGFLKSFPLQDLLAAQAPRDVAIALPPIFGHFQQKLKVAPVSWALLDSRPRESVTDPPRSSRNETCPS